MRKNLLFSLLTAFALMLMLPEKTQAQYCKPSFGSCSSGDSIYLFQLGSYIRKSGCSGGYDTTGVTTANIKLYRGKTYKIRILVGNTANFGVWIDYDKNKSYDQTNELVGVENAGVDSVSTTITIPLTAPLGKTRMRIMAVNGGTTDYNTSCNSYSGSGEAEDYTVTISAYPDDVGITSIVQPQNYFCPSSAQAVRAVIYNYGSNTKTTAPLVLKVGSTTLLDTMKYTLAAGATDTFTFTKTVNTSAGGTYAFKAYTNLPGDSDRTNDSASVSVIVSQPANPSVTGITHCGLGPVTLKGKSTTTGSQTYWYKNATTDTFLAVGDTFVTPYINKTGTYTYYAQSRFPTNNSITTTFSTSRANNGNMFDLVAKTTMTLDSFEVNFSGSTYDSGEVFIRKGSYVGNETNSSAWTLAGKATLLVNGSGKASRLRVGNIKLTAGSTYGIYVRYMGTSGQIWYDFGSNQYSNNDMVLKTGTSLGGLFSSPVPVRNWNGTIYYHYNTCQSSKVSVTATVNAVPIGKLTAGKSYHARMNSGTKTDPDIVDVGDTLRYNFIPPSGMAISDYTTKWTVSASMATKTGKSTSNWSIAAPSGSKDGTFTYVPGTTDKDSTYILTFKYKFVSTGCDSTITRYIRTIQKPTAAFSATTACLGHVTSFTNSSTGSAGTTNIWYFGTGDTSNRANPSYKYASAGTYTVSLVSGIQGITDSVTKSVTVNISPANSNIGKGVPFNGKFGGSINPDYICVTDTAKFDIIAPSPLTNSDYGSKWTITGITVLTPANTPIHDTIFRKPKGSTNGFVELFPSSKFADSVILLNIYVRTTAGGCDTILGRYIYVKPKPKAYFGATSVCLGKTVAFHDSSTISSGNSISTYGWDFGDGASGTGANINHTYAVAGYYTVKETISSDAGCPSTYTRNVYVYDRPVAKFGVTNFCFGDATVFTDSSTIGGTGAINTYLWRFGDGTTSSKANNTHTYAKTGLYTITLVVTSKTGCQDSITKSIKIQPKPTANFSFGTDNCVTRPYSFSDRSSNASSLVWDFGDGNTATGTLVQHTFAKAQSYTVTLIAYSSAGCSDTITRVVNPIASPTPHITTTLACEDRTVSFADSPNVSQTSYTYIWKFGDGTKTTLPTSATSYTYKKAGSYKVVLIETNSGGCVDSVSRLITVYPKLALSVTSDSVCQGGPNSIHLSATGNGTVARYFWDFGDGNRTLSHGTDTTHTYAAGGSYNVKIMAIKTSGCIDSVYHTVKVFDKPKVGPFAINIKRNTVTYTPSDTTYASYLWIFDGKDSSTKKVVKRYYTNKGTYHVQLIVTNTSGCSIVRKDSVTITTGLDAMAPQQTTDVKVYPNPFMGQTNIAYHLENAGMVLVTVHDLQGRQVAVLQDGKVPGGDYQLTFDANKYNVASGIYLLRVAVNDQVTVKQIVNMR
jgi:PKD repeat protein